MSREGVGVEIRGDLRRHQDDKSHAREGTFK